MQSRVERFKTYREQIAQNINDIEEEKLIVTEEVINQQNEDTLKRNTLTMSIDQIIEANNAYIFNIEQQRLLEEQKNFKKKKIQKIFIKYLIIVLCILTIVGIVIISIL